HLGRNGGALLIASGEPRERIARLTRRAIADLSLYLEGRRDLFGFGSEALFVSFTGARDRLPLRTIASDIQSQIQSAGLEERIAPSDLARYPAAKLVSEGVTLQDAILMLGYKRIPTGSRSQTEASALEPLKLFHPLHS